LSRLQPSATFHIAPADRRSLVARFFLYYNTLRHLRFAQIAARLRRHVSVPLPEVRPAPALRERACSWTACVDRPRSWISADRFRFLNSEHDVKTASDWNAAGREKLWLYNLHYFDFLLARESDAFTAAKTQLIERWIRENPIGSGNGWEPYPTSLRIVNWIKWSLRGNRLSASAIESLAAQCRYLERRLERHLGANHLFANAKALIFAGCFFGSAVGEHWRTSGVDLLDRELSEQILPDGGHFELSPMYHSIMLEDLLDLLNLAGTYEHAFGTRTPPLLIHLPELIARMFQWLAAMSHPDGDIAFFNDAAFGIAPSFSDLEKYATRLGISPKVCCEDVSTLSDSGYVAVRKGPATLIFDAASVGPDYNPGHAHADTLSFELSWGRNRVICNSGTSTYEAGPQRSWERSTAAHNAVAIDGENSSEVWAAFRVARRAHPTGLHVQSSAGDVAVTCAHDGYRRLRGSPVHRRTITIDAGRVAWRDEVDGRGKAEVTGFIPLHPNIAVERDSAHVWNLRLPSGEWLVLTIPTQVQCSDIVGSYAPEFGRVLTRPVIAWAVKGPLPLAAQFELRQIGSNP
jgi:uncharacterized heparinase superfamily protein